jgi:hypothetical protein
MLNPPISGRAKELALGRGKTGAAEEDMPGREADANFLEGTTRPPTLSVNARWLPLGT